MKLLFIGARLFDDVALYTKDNGITTVLTESNPKSANLNLADSHYIVPRGMEHPKEIALQEDVDGVIPLIGIDGPLFEVALLKEELERDYGLPVVASPPGAVTISGDKIKTKEFLVNHNIKTPEYNLISSKMDYNTEELTHNYPLVLKQAQGQGGKDIKIALSAEDVENYLEQYDQGLAERFLDGVEVSVEILRWNDSSIPLVPVYKGKTTPEGVHPLHKLKKAPLNGEEESAGQLREKIRRIALNIGELMGVEGTADLDLILNRKDQETYVLEINTRPSGTRYLTAASCDIHPLCELVDMATGSWNSRQVAERMKNYCALEVPVGKYPMERNNYQYRKFQGDNSWVIHGPENHQRITIRGKTEAETLQTAKNLNLQIK
ncbi:acetyl-CoA carboxylase biotin carboxylase subunit family protein [Methanobacterium sp. BAmetb5]|uniref:ATP-grasp domain-containing protein n=1 Tax=Methanobacterium sp. BAmetb5 TaxID=2025351 RepID=UPI000E7E797C|nr:ATP-grasp domain-containing protein [Methanobacterium sp. BAmetb5]AXV39605.1 MAG: carboxylate--amine ligase [Methanobacterium sp. BAmetb5]